MIDETVEAAEAGSTHPFYGNQWTGGGVGAITEPGQRIVTVAYRQVKGAAKDYNYTGSKVYESYVHKKTGELRARPVNEVGPDRRSETMSKLDAQQHANEQNIPYHPGIRQGFVFKKNYKAEQAVALETKRAEVYNKGSAAELNIDIVTAADGHIEGKPTMGNRIEKMRKAVQVAAGADDRFKPTGQSQYMLSRPYVIDVTVPDDDGKHHAIISNRDGKLVKHGFDYDADGDTATLHPGDSQPTECTTVYTRLCEQHDEIVKAQAAKEKQTQRAKADTVHCRVAIAVKTEDGAWQQDVPVPIMWMPKGVTTVQAGFRDRSLELTVDCGDTTASTVQASLEDWLAANDPQKPMICIEHREHESAGWPVKFEDKGDGVYCSLTPSGLGADNVNKKIHRSFSPSFTTDADYSKCVCATCKQPVAKCSDCSGMLKFPDGVRGSKTNPAEVTGVGDFSIGSLTNRPAFRNIAPVKASEPKQEEKVAPVKRTSETILAEMVRQATPPEPQLGQPKGKQMKMKLEFIKAHSTFKVGQIEEVDANDVGVLLADGIAERHEVMESNRNTAKTVKASYVTRITDAVKRAKDRGAVAVKDEAVLAEGLKKLENIDAGSLDVVSGLVVDQIDRVPGKDEAVLAQRVTKGGDGLTVERINHIGVSIQDASAAVIKAREPQDKLIKEGRWKEAQELSKVAATISRSDLFTILAQGGDFMLRDTVKGADYTDPNSQVGTLATGLILQRNLGFLKNKLGWMKYISTDFSGEPAKFGQPIFTRYLTPPGVLKFVPGVGFTSDASTISTASAGTNQSGVATQTSGTRTISVPSATDVTVTMNQFQATEISFPITTLAATVRNLLSEQLSCQTYSLAEAVNKSFLTTLFSATWTGIVTSMALGSFGLPGMVQIKDRMSLAKIPDIMRFALLHSYFYDGLLVDANLLTSKAILALIDKDSSAFNGGEVPPLFGIRPIETQLASFASGVFTSPNITAAGGNVDFSGINQVGFAGNQSSMVFVSRAPQDFTATAAQLGVPVTAKVEIITEPDSGLQMMVYSYIDNGTMAIVNRVCLMWGQAQGHPGMGIVLTP